MRRSLIAIGVGFLGCLFIWIAAPYNNFLLNNSFISDTYFPVAAVIFTLIIVLVVNPLLRLLGNRAPLNRHQLMLMFALLLAGSVVPSQGLMRMLPWSLARANQDINSNKPLFNAVKAAGIHESLFPDELGFDRASPFSEQLLTELPEDQPIPWKSWFIPALIWGVFFGAAWLIMIAVGLILFPEWKNKERLPFPLINIYRSLLGRHDSASVIPDIFKNRLFWIGATTVMLLYALNGLEHHTNGAFPGFPLGWRLSQIFTESPWRYLNYQVKNVEHIYFILVGMAFFMPNRAGFSIWFTTLGYAVYEMLRNAYFPGVYRGVVTDHRNGAMIAIALMALYLSRRHWKRVGKLMISRATSDEERLYKVAGWMLAMGCTLLFLWLIWANVPVLWAAIYVAIGFLVSLLIARIVAETGMPFVRITGMNPLYFMGMLPASIITGAALYMGMAISMAFQLGSRVSAAVMVSHAVGLDETNTPRQQLRLGGLMFSILLIGFVIAGAVHLQMGYRFATSLDGKTSPLCAWGSQQLRSANGHLIRWSQEALPAPNTDQMTQLGVGIVLATGLQLACIYIPKWPLHPIGMILAGHFYGLSGWASILIGWGLKVFIIKYGGAIAFTRARAIFLGIILGEVFSAIIWTLIPLILIACGNNPADVGHIPLLPR